MMPRTHETKAKNACQRCRRRRIRCDGATPSCAQCEKAGVACIEGRAIAGRENLPRAFLNDSLARLAALEDLVRARLPDVDLSDLSSNTAGNPEVSHPRAGQPHAKRRKDFDDRQQDPRHTDYDAGLISSNLAVPHLQTPGPLTTKSCTRLFPDIAHQHQHQTLGGTEKRTLLAEICELLPTRLECDRLVLLFFSHSHAAYSVLHEPSIASLIDAIYACGSVPYDCLLDDTGWPEDVAAFAYNGEVDSDNGTTKTSISVTTAAALLFHVLGIASYVEAHRHRLAADPRKYGETAFRLTSISMGDITLASVQLAVLAVQHGFLSQHHGSPWALLQLGMTYAIELGLHIDGDYSEHPPSVPCQMRRRVFFCVYRLDRLISSVQGRPLAFSDDYMDFTFPATIHNHADGHTPDTDQKYLGFMDCRVQWARLISEIKSTLHRASTFVPPISANTGMQFQEHMLARLDEWLAASIDHVKAVQPPTRRLNIELQIDYHYAIGLLFQPSTGCPAPDAAALRRCYDSASLRLRLSWSQHGEACLIQSWLDTQCLSLAGSMMAYCIWNSPELRSSISVTELSSDFRLCSSLLALAGEWWPSAKKGGQSFQRLADSTIDLVIRGRRSESTTTALTASWMAESSNHETLAEQRTVSVEDMLNEFLQEDFQLPEWPGGHDASGCSI